MSGLSLMQTKSSIDRLGDLDEEITRVCRTGEAVAKGAPKGHGDEVSRLKTAMKAAEECQKHVLMAKAALLGFDGFLHAQRPSLRQALMHPSLGTKAANFLENLGKKAGPAMEHHVGGLAEEATEAVGRVKASLQALRVAEETDARGDDAKLSCDALRKTLSAAEKAIVKAVKMAKSTPDTPRREEAPEPEVEEVEETAQVEETPEVAAKTAAHGYDLTAGELPDFIKEKVEEREGKKDDKDDDDKSDKKAGKLPPEFLENAQKKKDEAAGKNQDEAADKDDDEKVGGKKAHGFDLAAALPPEFLENAQKKKDEAAGKKDDDEDDDKGKKKADSEDPDPSMEKDLPGEDTEGEPVVDKSAKAKESESKDPGDPSMDTEEEGEGEGYDPGHVIEAAGHGYQITDPSDHSYELTA
jgi:hypothetical protein